MFLVEFESANAAALFLVEYKSESASASASFLVEFKSQSVNASALLLFESDFEFDFEYNAAT